MLTISFNRSDFGYREGQYSALLIVEEGRFQDFKVETRFFTELSPPHSGIRHTVRSRNVNSGMLASEIIQEELEQIASNIFKGRRRQFKWKNIEDWRTELSRLRYRRLSNDILRDIHENSISNEVGIYCLKLEDQRFMETVDLR